MVHFSESFLTFLVEKRESSRVADLILKGQSYSPAYDVYSKILTDKEANYITMRPDGMISYLPAGKEHKVNDRGEWMRDGRQSGKAGKIIRKVFNEKLLRFIAAKEFEQFGNAYKAKFLDNGFIFEIRPNTQVPDVYCMTKAPGEASLNGSCMNGDRAYLDIYTEIKELRILILLNKEGLLCGRALLWNLKHKSHGDIVFMDRIYVVEDYMYEIFFNYARENNMWRKVDFKTFTKKNIWINPDTDSEECMEFKIKTNTDFDRYPYIDTFSYGTDGTLNNYTDIEYTYDCTDGKRGNDDRFPSDSEEEDNHDDETYDEINDEYISNDDAVTLSGYSERQYRHRTTHVYNCVEAYVRRRNTEWFHKDDENIQNVDGDWFLNDHDDIVCRADGEWDLYDNCVQCETDSEYYERGDSELLESENGNYYHKENDGDVIYIQGHGYAYKPDLDDDAVVYVPNQCQWFWAKDKSIKKIAFHMGDCCQSIYVLKSELVKHRNRYYHRDDHRLIKKLTTKTRIAQAA